MGEVTIVMLDQGLSVLSEEYRRHSGVPLKVSTLSKIRHTARLRRCEPRSYAVRAGQISQSVFMVVSGLFRSYRIEDSGHEWTQCFLEQGAVAGFCSALLHQETVEFVQALETSHILELPLQLWDDLHVNDPQTLAQMSVWQAAVTTAIQKRQAELLSLNATQRLKLFVANYPQLIARVTKEHLASYLGIAAPSLSRIWAQVCSVSQM